MHRAKVIHHTSTHATAIDEYTVAVIFRMSLEYAACECDSVDAVVDSARNGSSIAALSEEYDGVVGTVACYVYAQGKGFAWVDGDITARGFVNLGSGEELHQAMAREDTTDTDPEPVAVLAIGLEPLGDLGFVRDRDFAGVDLTAAPMLGKAPIEELFEPADVAGWVAED